MVVSGAALAADGNQAKARTFLEFLEDLGIGFSHELQFGGAGLCVGDAACHAAR